MSLGNQIARLEELMAALHFVAGWEDEMREWAKDYCVTEEEMREIWLRCSGRSPCTSMEQWCALHEELTAQGYESRE